jgi:hypothetical protein
MTYEPTDAEGGVDTPGGLEHRPVIFSAPMVRALLAGRKTQTRRAINPQPLAGGYYEGPVSLDRVFDGGSARFSARAVGGGAVVEECAPLRFAVGDRLWVREVCRGEELESGQDGVRYRADDAFRPIENTQSAGMRWLELHTYRGDKGAWVTPIHVPRWASRLTLAVTEARVQRLQEISEADAEAEGVGRADFPDWPVNTFRGAYRGLWERLHGAGSWAANPWVAAISFEKEK